ncbi:MAG: metal ABC transporter substrate-binding protein [Actinomycetaceae bacterium]|nr:metal ABC transporter substrate-binding protein [Actinomycetaceae bacterium]
MKKRYIAALAAFAFPLTACGGSNAATADELNVLTSFYPLQYLAQEIGGNHVKVSNLTPAGGEPHDLELNTKDVAAIGDSAVVIYQKGFQKAVDDAVKQTSPKHAVDVSGAVKLVPMKDHEVQDADVSDEDAKTKKDASEADHEDAHGDEHGHDHDGLDPHFWLDPARMKEAVPLVVKGLSDAAPNHKADFEKNGQELVKKLENLDSSYQNGLKQCKLDTIIVSHEAYGYMAAKYGFKQIGLAGFDPEQEASPAQLKKIEQVAKSKGITTIFSEDKINTKTAQTMAKDLGIKSEVLNPLESLSDAKMTYDSEMKANLQKLKAALQCQ